MKSAARWFVKMLRPRRNIEIEPYPSMKHVRLSSNGTQICPGLRGRTAEIICLYCCVLGPRVDVHLRLPGESFLFSVDIVYKQNLCAPFSSTAEWYNFRVLLSQGYKLREIVPSPRGLLCAVSTEERRMDCRMYVEAEVGKKVRSICGFLPVLLYGWLCTSGEVILGARHRVGSTRSSVRHV